MADVTDTRGGRVAPEMLENARQRWAEKRDPALAQKVRSLADLVDQYERTPASSRRIIEKVGDLQTDAIELLDTKGAA